VELDLVSGFHADPARLLVDGRADAVVGSEITRRAGVVQHPLFRFEILGVLPVGHRLAGKRQLSPGDFADETLITYPVPADRIDVIRRFLAPARVRPRIRTVELTIAILQLVASRRGVAALPNWGIRNYVDYEYVVARRLGPKGLWSDLYIATTERLGVEKYVEDFIETVRTECFRTLKGLRPLGRGGKARN
jgi:LysR family transcriptional regulator, regulator for metE and metH